MRLFRRGPEAYTGDERILGRSDFVEAVRHAGEARGRRMALPTLTHRIGESLGLSLGGILGRSRVPAAARARQILAHVWVVRLGQRASELPTVLGQTRGNISLAAKQGEDAARPWRKRFESSCQ